MMIKITMNQLKALCLRVLVGKSSECSRNKEKQNALKEEYVCVRKDCEIIVCD